MSNLLQLFCVSISTIFELLIKNSDSTTALNPPRLQVKEECT